MKLYATTTSERATKGQGGNKSIEIMLQVRDDERKTDDYVGRVNLYVTTSGSIVMSFTSLVNEQVVKIELPRRYSKGKKEKGELCNCGRNPGFHEKQGNCK